MPVASYDLARLRSRFDRDELYRSLWLRGYNSLEKIKNIEYPLAGGQADNLHSPEASEGYLLSILSLIIHLQYTLA